MRCPPEISEILLRILEHGLLRIRALGWSGQAELCALEADHIHNLPGLLMDFSQERLAYYWTVERVGYSSVAPADQLVVWETFWQELQPHVDRMSTAPASAR
jgi:hypothetical protein